MEEVILNEGTTETPRNLLEELITLSIKKKDLFFIGQTLSTKYINSDIAPFINKINKICIDGENLEDDVQFDLNVQMLFNIIEKLGRESEFYYADFNNLVKTILLTELSTMTDLELSGYIIQRLTYGLTSIENFKNVLVQQYIQNQGL